MPVLNRIASYAGDMTGWRRWMHRNPELGFECRKTAAFVAGRLRDFGVDEIHEGIATTGIVAIIRGKGDGPTIGLRADMDALPIEERTGAEWASETPGAMHACGHDGHTAMLLGAARYLAETRNFSGRAALIFQPAEEGGGGGRAMCDEGVMERFDIGSVYALHNAPDRAEGTFGTRAGPIMAAVDEFDITVTGVGGHAAWPWECKDPVAAVMQIGQAFNTIVSRNVAAGTEAVVSVTTVHAGTAFNIVPQTAKVGGTVRTFDSGVRSMIRRRMEAICAGIGAAMDVDVDFEWIEGYPATVNHGKEAAFAAEVARGVVGADKVSDDEPPQMGAEDFAYMLERRPGAYLFLGQGIGPFCHHPAFDFNDDVAPVGASFFAKLVETAQPVE